RVTVKRLRVVRIDPQRNLLLVRGATPGIRGALLTVRSAGAAKEKPAAGKAPGAAAPEQKTRGKARA
ncbi:MAG TPA: hypothetical protein VFM39_08240, partial [bacterium]|nr:hypothetical protein [bacterium]